MLLLASYLGDPFLLLKLWFLILAESQWEEAGTFPLACSWHGDLALMFPSLGRYLLLTLLWVLYVLLLLGPLSLGEHHCWVHFLLLQP